MQLCVDEIIELYQFFFSLLFPLLWYKKTLLKNHCKKIIIKSICNVFYILENKKTPDLLGKV